MNFVLSKRSLKSCFIEIKQFEMFVGVQKLRIMYLSQYSISPVNKWILFHLSFHGALMLLAQLTKALILNSYATFRNTLSLTPRCCENKPSYCLRESLVFTYLLPAFIINQLHSLQDTVSSPILSYECGCFVKTKQCIVED
jgi:hypothetical protein